MASSLKVPDLGLELESPTNAASSGPTQAFALSLSDAVIEDLIQCVQAGENVQLSLGNSPTFLYGSQSHTPAPTSDSHPFDLYLTKPFESTKRASRIPSTSSLWQKPSSPHSENGEHAGRPRNATTSSASSARDSDVETLQNSIAAAEASKKHTSILETMPKKATGKSVPKSKYLSSMSSYASGTKSGSLPSSPALTAVGSPSLNQGYGASQQTLEKAKGQRTMIVHELAAAERHSEYLEAKWSGQPDDFNHTLQKVAEFNSDTQLWALKRTYWKELDVWKYDYDNPEDRQSAIDKAIKIFDRLRLGLSEPQWEKLMRKEERGKGKVLSELQAKIAKGPATQAPKIKVQKAEDADSEAGGDDALKVEGGEPMQKSSSQTSTKKKSVLSRLTSNKTKASTPKAGTPKSTQPKSTKDTSSTASGAKGGKFKSAEFISDSDSDSSESKPMAVAAASKVKKTSPGPKASPQPSPSPSKLTEKEARSPAVKPKAKARPVEKPAASEPPKPTKPKQVAKRPREEEPVDESESSSSSGRPLAKRIKPKAATGDKEKVALKSVPNLKQRSATSSAPDTQKTSRSTPSTNNGNLSFKSTKNTSPAKSSPLATSPPTNASDLERGRHRPSPEPATTTAAASRKRKIPADVSDDASSSKGSTTSSSIDEGNIKRRKVPGPKVMHKAETFMKHYKRYEALHHEIAGMDRPPRQEMERLNRMRNRLAELKAEIYDECPPTIPVA